MVFDGGIAYSYYLSRVEICGYYADMMEVFKGTNVPLVGDWERVDVGQESLLLFLCCYLKCRCEGVLDCIVTGIMMVERSGDNLWEGWCGMVPLLGVMCWSCYRLRRVKIGLGLERMALGVVVFLLYVGLRRDWGGSGA